MTIPEDLIDEHGYPTEEWLEFIRTYKPTEEFPVRDFVALLHDGLWTPSWCYVLRRRRLGVRKLELHTGGWSGNEEVVQAILANFMLRHTLGYHTWHRGGHYYFRFMDTDLKAEKK